MISAVTRREINEGAWLTTLLCEFIVSTYSDVIRVLFGRNSVVTKSAAYIGFPTVTTITLALGFHRQVDEGEARVRQERHGPVGS